MYREGCVGSIGYPRSIAFSNRPDDCASRSPEGHCSVAKNAAFDKMYVEAVFRRYSSHPGIHLLKDTRARYASHRRRGRVDRVYACKAPKRPSHRRLCGVLGDRAASQFLGGSRHGRRGTWCDPDASCRLCDNSRVGMHIPGPNYFYYARDPWDSSFCEYVAHIDHIPERAWLAMGVRLQSGGRIGEAAGESGAAAMVLAQWHPVCTATTVVKPRRRRGPELKFDGRMRAWFGTSSVSHERELVTGGEAALRPHLS